MPYEVVDNIRIRSLFDDGSMLVIEGENPAGLFQFCDKDGIQYLLVPQGKLTHGINHINNQIIWFEGETLCTFDVEAKSTLKLANPPWRYARTPRFSLHGGKLHLTTRTECGKTDAVYVLDGEWKFLFEYAVNTTLRWGDKIVTYTAVADGKKMTNVVLLETMETLLSVPYTDISRLRLQPNGDIFLNDRIYRKTEPAKPPSTITVKSYVCTDGPTLTTVTVTDGLVTGTVNGIYYN